ncbi:MAG TPA: SDR family NAD-dependent epimerase/dehydratase, partial [Albitalea sp.]|nr:SDR family NAD-dependent epimerase/dehydratase [Albitalea sp.]
RSFCYVDDLIDGMLRLMNSGDAIAGPVNVGNPDECTIRELAERIVEMTGSRSAIVYRPLPSDDPLQRCPDISRAREWLGWQPKVSLQQGLDSTIRYFERLLSRRS